MILLLPSARGGPSARRPALATAGVPGPGASPVSGNLERTARPGGPGQRAAVLGSRGDDTGPAAEGRHLERDEGQARWAQVAWLLQDHPLRDHRRRAHRLPVQPSRYRGNARRPPRRCQDPHQSTSAATDGHLRAPRPQVCKPHRLDRPNQRTLQSLYAATSGSVIGRL